MQKPASDNSALAADVAAAGIPTFPCEWSGEAAKRPMPGIYWRNEATASAVQVAAWWRGYPQALPGIALGRVGLFVIDADRHEGGADGVTAWDALCAAHDYPPPPCAETPSGGRHYYFRQPEGDPLGNSPGRLPKGIDVRGSGGYVIAPGAELPDGRRYSGLEGFGLNAPLPPDWLITEYIKAPKDEPPRPPRPGNAAPASIASEARIKAYAETAFAAELARLRGAGTGTRNNTLNEVAFAIGTLIGAGWIGEASARDTLLTEALAIGLGRAESAATINSGVNAGKASPREMPPDRQEVDALGAAAAISLTRNVDGSFYDAETGEVVELPPAADANPDWLYPGGLLGEITEWILETTPRRPNRPLAVAAAIVVVGTMLSRTLAGPTRSGTHLYVSCIGGTGIGKDWPQRAIALIMEACGLACCISSGKWKSDVALEGGVADAPAQIAVIDEIGQNLFAPIMGRRAGSHQAGISVVLRQLWSASFATYQTSSSAARRTQTIRSPALSIYGASTIEEFYDSLTGDATENGFLNRFLLVQAAPRAKPNRVTPAEIKVPEHIVKGLCALLRGGGNMEGGAYALTAPRAPLFEIMPWANAEVCDAFERFDEAMIDKADKDPDCAKFLGRTAEMSLRLATIHAASRAGRGAVLEMQDLEWGQAVAWASADIMMLDVRSRMADNEAQGKYKLVERIIREGARKEGIGLKRRDLLRKLAGKIPERELDSILSALIGAEIIGVYEHKPEGGGRPSLRYVYFGERKAAA